MVFRSRHNEAQAIFEILVRENEAMLMTYLRAAVRNQSAVEDLLGPGSEVLPQSLLWHIFEKLNPTL